MYLYRYMYMYACGYEYIFLGICVIAANGDLAIGSETADTVPESGYKITNSL